MKRGSRRRLFWPVAAAFAAVLALGSLTGFLAELLWFGELGQTRAFWEMFQARLIMRLGLGALYAGVFFLNLRIAARSFGSIRRRIANIEIHEAIKPLHLNVAAAVGAAALAFLFTAGVGSQWPRLLLFLNPTSFGLTDPIFGKDVAFYVFRLPFYQYLQTNLLVLLILNFLLVVVVYFTTGALELTSQHFVIKDRPRRHLAVLLAALFAVLAWGYRLDMLNLVHSRRGVVHGASFTDVHAQIPGYWVLIAVAMVAALVTVWRGLRGDLRPVAMAAAAVVAASLLLKVMLPGLVQQFIVEPDEIAKESPYIAHNIRLTRAAFGLDRVERRRFPLKRGLDSEVLAKTRAEIQSIRLWDWRPLLQTYAQLQEIRLYYSFADVDVDRYPLGGQSRQVMLSLREMRTEDLAPSAQTWQNVHLVYTHGYGFVVSPVDEVSSEGLPNFFVRDIPPVLDQRAAGAGFEIQRPEIYYGEETGEYVVVNTREQEFDYPRGDSNVYTRYRGRGGVPLDAAWKRLLFAWRFGTPKIVLADAITARSRLMFRRRISERVQHLAPFLLYDGDPYPVVFEGRLFWIQDAYTASAEFPYSEPIEFQGMGINYVRNSVKAVIDAYHGGVTFYAVDERDPILATYRRIFPELFRPAAEMPAGLWAHVRYPEDLFTAQSRALQAYHMTDARVFYNKEDYWNFPNEIYEESPQPMLPYYVVLRLPGERDPQFLLILPFTPAGKDNMVAMLAAKSDGADYGELVLYELPKDELIFGPMQVEARIDQDSRISQQITLWSQKGSTVIRGNLLVIPLEGAILYIEPLFLQAQKSRLPELKQVIGAFGSRIVMTPTLQTTLARLLEQSTGPPRAEAETELAAVEERPRRDADERPLEGARGDRIRPAEPEGLRDAPARADPAHALELYREAIAAQRGGDWATYGDRLRELGAVLEALARGVVTNGGEVPP